MLLGITGWETECAVYQHLGLEQPKGAAGPCDGRNVDVYRQAQENKSVPVDNSDNGHRYSLNMDGTGVSERLAQQLAGSQLVFKVDSPFYNYYSRFFLPYVHYVPVKYDLSDLAEKASPWWMVEFGCGCFNVFAPQSINRPIFLNTRQTNRWPGQTTTWRRRTPLWCGPAPWLARFSTPTR